MARRWQCLAGGSTGAERVKGKRGGQGPCWYVCYTRARHEKRVAARLEERGFDTFLPLVPRVRQWHDREKVVHWPLFPSYVFVHCNLRSLADVMRTPGIATVVRFNGRPVPVPEAEIQSVRRFVDVLGDGQSESWEPGPLVETGQDVRVTSGPFRGITGVVLEQRRHDKTLIQIGVEAIAQGVKVEVDTNRLETMGGEEVTNR